VGGELWGVVFLFDLWFLKNRQEVSWGGCDFSLVHYQVGVAKSEALSRRAQKLEKESPNREGEKRDTCRLGAQ